MDLSSHSRTRLGFSCLLILLSFVHLLALSSLFHLAYRNGYANSIIQHLYSLKHLPCPMGSPYVLCPKTPILQKLTLIPPFDYMLRIANVLFVHVTDGSAPDLSLYAWHFSGQWAGVYMCLVAEGARRGAAIGVWWSIVLGLVFNNYSYGVCMPLWVISNLLYTTSFPNDSLSFRESLRLKNSAIPVMRAFPKAMLFGYWTPLALMCITQGPLLRQWFNGTWQGFPYWIMGLCWFFSGNERRLASAVRKSKKNAALQDAEVDRAILRPIYRLALIFCLIPHLSTVLLLSKNIVFQRSSVVFDDHISSSLTFRSVFVPPLFWTSTPQEDFALEDGEVDMAKAAKTLFQYDQIWGSTAALIWAIRTWWVALRERKSARQESKKGIGRERTREKGLVRFWLEVVVVAMLMGPVGSIIWLVEMRDELAFEL